VKSFLLSALAFLILPFPSRAQDTPKADIAAGYSFLWIGQGFTFFMNGGSGSVALNLNNCLGAVGDFGAYRADPGVSLTAETYTFGPRFSYRKWERLTPFAQVLVGGQHTSAATTGFTNASNAFAFGAGGGTDIGLDHAGKFALRPQLEYFGFRANGNTTGTVRFALGVVFRIGRKS
jgi:outer membrane immunogenic protein